MKKVISITLILSLILSMFGAINAFAATQGKCGDNLSWTFDGETVTISGIGNMYDYEFVGTTDRSPWSENTRVKYVVINDGVTSIGEGAFDSCDEIINVSIPNSVRTIGKHAFASCDNLTNLKLPNSLESIGKMAFALCHNIKSVTIPGSVIKIGDNAFGCSGLEEVVIMEGVQIIDTSAFTFCRYLENITFPSTITFIGANAFTHCEKLKNVTIPRKTNVADNAFDSNVVISYQDNTSIASQSKPIKVTLDGTYINFDVQPTEINGRVLVPVRAIFEALGAKVDWNESKNEVIATKGDVTIRLYKDNTTMYRNNNAITLDVPAKDIGDRILVPVRAISEAFGCKVDWNDANSQVVITANARIDNDTKNKSNNFIKFKNYIIENGKYDNNCYSIVEDIIDGKGIIIDYYVSDDIITITSVDDQDDYLGIQSIELTELGNSYKAISILTLNSEGERTLYASSTINPTEINKNYIASIEHYDMKEYDESILKDFSDSQVEQIKDLAINTMSEGIQITVLCLGIYLEENNVGLSLSDFGFNQYENLYNDTTTNNNIDSYMYSDAASNDLAKLSALFKNISTGNSKLLEIFKYVKNAKTVSSNSNAYMQMSNIANNLEQSAYNIANNNLIKSAGKQELAYELAKAYTTIKKASQLVLEQGDKSYTEQSLIISNLNFSIIGALNDAPIKLKELINSITSLYD